jgi:CO/xanthine dehydrogenase FAD-binding subunit
MKPVAFDYRCPDTVDEALALLANSEGDVKLMAGGQSLVPMLNYRVVRPDLVIDISRLLELDFVREREGGGLVIGALARHRTLETSALVARHFPIIPDTMQHVAHLAIRNRGTLGGSVSHADPAAELPMLMRLLDAQIVAQSLRGERRIAAADFFIGALTTALADDEMLVRVELPALHHSGWAFEEFARRAGDYALAATGVLLDVADGRIRDARVAMMGIADTPLRRPEAEALLIGQAPTEAVLQDAAHAACNGLEPRQDLHASSDFRLHLAGALTARVLRRAAERVAAAAAGDPA